MNLATQFRKEKMDQTKAKMGITYIDIKKKFAKLYIRK